MEEGYIDGQIDITNLYSLYWWSRSKGGFCLLHNGQPTRAASSSVWIPSHLATKPRWWKFSLLYQDRLSPPYPGVRLLYFLPIVFFRLCLCRATEARVNSRPCIFRRKSIYNYVFCLCSMAQSQADWELDKVEMEWSRLAKQTGGRTLAEWKLLGWGLATRSWSRNTSWFS